MRRIILMLMATALMVALMGASALPAFAQVVEDPIGEEGESGGDVVIPTSTDAEKCDEARDELAQAEASGNAKDKKKAQDKVAEYCPPVEEAPAEG